ncbi:hypothetical protein TVAG_170200 [Trichomonas vaginalis G3]|uniref:Uncharacterized protein n=1 Tax=Trichomonas vaginalis (strain ATCC PRA-98 / G3) TaxID=412133 RepID=A2DPG2_TRIV3|nr:biological adhesion protein [Trichomonas vaginalis G3]EAY17706.1 hypothetical protein TVAG_170200 [Trichomonas vaginalis G3]KAI5507889.1 biological adhesion protein [Trichomonas vaginalis G3]|eukprot:XP_001329841.1 hypothetical protein [Trichomonas vaginalis G3]
MYDYDFDRNDSALRIISERVTSAKNRVDQLTKSNRTLREYVNHLELEELQTLKNIPDFPSSQSIIYANDKQRKQVSLLTETNLLASKLLDDLEALRKQRTSLEKKVYSSQYNDSPIKKSPNRVRFDQQQNNEVPDTEYDTLSYSDLSPRNSPQFNKKKLPLYSNSVKNIVKSIDNGYKTVEDILRAREESNKTRLENENREHGKFMKEMSDKMSECEEEIKKLSEEINKLQKKSKINNIEIIQDLEEQISQEEEIIENYKIKISSRKETVNNSIEKLEKERADIIAQINNIDRRIVAIRGDTDVLQSEKVNLEMNLQSLNAKQHVQEMRIKSAKKLLGIYDVYIETVHDTYSGKKDSNNT